MENNSPVAWVVGDDEGLGSYISESLVSLGVKVVRQKISTPLSALPRPDYIFYIPQTQNESLNFLETVSRVARELLEVARTSRAKFLLVVDETLVSKVAKKIVKAREAEAGVDARIVKVDGLYGPRVPLAGIIGQSLKEAMHKKLVRESSPQTAYPKHVRPLFVEDAARGILAAMFGASTRGREFIFNIPTLSVEHFRESVFYIAQSGKPLHTENFTEGTFKVSRENLNFTPTPLEVGIKKTLISLESEKGRPVFLKEEKRDSRSKPVWTLLAAAILIALTPFILMFAASGLLVLSTRQIRNGDFATSREMANVSETLFRTSHRTFRKLSQVPVVGNFFSPPTQTAYVGELAGQALKKAIGVGALGRDVLSGVFGKKEVSPSTLLRTAQDLEDLAVSVGFLKAQTKKSGVFGIGEQFLNIPNLFDLSSIAKTAPDLLGYRGKRTYLVLFQNNMELRGTGGFIGSFGLLTFENGKLSNIEIEDIYTADGQLRGHVEPPEKLKEHLGEAGWFMRDSNWSPNFPTTAARAEWFLDKELEKKVDGVIAVDLEFAKKLLGITGQIDIPDFGEKVGEQNFYEVTQKRAEVNFFPGSTQKADFLTALNRALIQEISFGIENSTIPLAEAILTSLEERHMLVFLHNGQAQGSIKELGWDGGIKNAKCKVQGSNCVEDYLMVVEANVGVNKANYLLSRKFLMDVVIDNDFLSHKLKVSYVNRGRARYKSYVRFYLPKGVNGVKSDLTLDESAERGKDVFGTLVEVPPNESLELDFSWNLPVTTKESALSFLWQKQPGTIDDSVVLRFHPQNGSRLSLSPSPSLTGGGGLGYTTILRKDLEAEITWTLR